MGGFTTCSLCNSTSKNSSTIKFHRPTTSTRKKTWLRALKTAGVLVKHKDSLVVCSLHFPNDSFKNIDDGQVKLITEFAIPSIFISEQISGLVFIEATEDATLLGLGLIRDIATSQPLEDVSADQECERPPPTEESSALPTEPSQRRDENHTEAPREVIWSPTSPLPNYSIFKTPPQQLEMSNCCSAGFDVSRRLFSPTLDNVANSNLHDSLPIANDESLKDGESSGSEMSEDDIDLLCVGEATPSPSRSALKRERERLRHQKRLLLEKTHEKSFSILKFLDDARAMKYYTGFKNYQVFYNFYVLFSEDSSYMRYLGSTQKDSEALEWNAQFIPKGKQRTLSKMDEMFMTMMRLRCGYDLIHLGHLFGLSEGQVSRIVNTWILLMSDRLGQINLWQSSKSKTALLVPDDAKDFLRDLKVIIDATELYTEKPSSTRAQKEIFSSYKNCTTGKCLVGVDGNGVITFFSRVYAGRTSDKKLLLHCGLIELLNPGDVIMADRGFDIAEDMANIGVELIIPDFLKGKSQFTAAELIHSEKVAEIRVHVERAIRKIKQFKILRGPIPLTLTPMIDNLWTCCAVLANFTDSGYLVKPKKNQD